jgi:hypothetical protein
VFLPVATTLALPLTTGTPAPTKTQSLKKSTAFNIKQQRVVFLELNYKERKNT